MAGNGHLVCLTFDFDAWSGLAARGLLGATSISRGEFGLVGVQRILALLRNRGIKATFFIPGIVVDSYPAACEAIHAQGHEIGHHGYTHFPPSKLSAEEEWSGLVRATQSIVGITGTRPVGFRSPSWEFSDHTVAFLEKEGFRYSSNQMGNDYTPYWVRQGDVASATEPIRFGRKTDVVEMPVHWALDDFPYFEFLRADGGILPGLRNARSVLDNWLGEYAYFRKTCDWGVLTYTFHPYVIGRGHRMLVLEELIEKLESAGATFVQMKDAAQAFVEKSRRGELDIYP